jgi:predicted CopG family antitoxin
MATTIQISDETWNRLIKRKTRPSHTFDGIISECLDKTDKKNKQ